MIRHFPLIDIYFVQICKVFFLKLIRIPTPISDVSSPSPYQTSHPHPHIKRLIPIPISNVSSPSPYQTSHPHPHIKRLIPIPISNVSSPSPYQTSHPHPHIKRLIPIPISNVSSPSPYQTSHPHPHIKRLISWCSVVRSMPLLQLMVERIGCSCLFGAMYK